MSIKLEYTVFETTLGWVGILASEKGLLAVTLPRSTAEDARRELGAGAEGAEYSKDRFVSIADRLKAYFCGENVPFPDELDLSAATPFEKQVWQQTRLIPFGETRSYLGVAEKIGKPGAARAVGQALGRNPLLIIVPCHRVVASGGGLGGFGGGLDMKRWLLEMEGNPQTRGGELPSLRSQ